MMELDQKAHRRGWLMGVATERRRQSAEQETLRAWFEGEIRALRAEFDAGTRALRSELQTAREDLHRLRMTDYFASAERDWSAPLQ
jgi:hypothetical protein